MTHSTAIVKLFAASVIPVLVGIGVATSATGPADRVDDVTVDEGYRPGADGVDFAAVTGPRAPSEPGWLPACADPARKGALRDCLK